MFLTHLRQFEAGKFNKQIFVDFIFSNMPKHLYTLTSLLFICIIQSKAQTIEGTITDSTGKPLAFATIKFGDTRQGIMADLKGKFHLRLNTAYQFITISHLGYKTRRIEVAEFTPGKSMDIELEFSAAELGEVVIKSTTNKIKRILGSALNNRNKNNPDKYDWYQCNVYYKMVLDGWPDSTIQGMDSADWKDTKALIESQHFFMTETFSRRTWERPQKLQEEVLGTRISGFKKAWFSSLVTDILPFHGYSDFLQLNGKDYHNPLSSGLYQRFDFRLEDEILQGTDTVWHISFIPKKKNSEMLSGSLYIHSNMFALSNLKAQHYDSSLSRAVGIEQQYQRVNDKWFPQQLNYFIRWDKIAGEPVHLAMTGTSMIDSVTFEKDKKFRFDKAHTTKIKPGADELSDTAWQALRNTPLNKKEIRTYEWMDSLGAAEGFDKFPTLAEKLVQGFIPWGKHVEIDIQRLYSYNRYEKHRLGFGLRTSDKILKRFTVGGWFGYGTNDKNWKYGASAEFYADKYKEFVFKFNYRNDLQDPGRLQVNKELDRNFLRRFLLGRVDNIRSYSFEMSKRLGYWQMALGFNAEEILPQYNYTFSHDGKSWNNFTTKEIILNLRYAYAERMSPLLGKYYSSGSRYPILYSKIRFGEINTNKTMYIHAIAALKWQTHINGVGKEQFLILAGGTFSKQPLPLSKLFAGNGFQIDKNAVFVFGGMQTMLPYEYYSDRFINFYWKHDFDWRFYNLKLTRKLSSAPSLSLGYNLLVGSLKNREAHQHVSFSVPDNAYHETGFMLNRIIRTSFLNMYHINFNAGYYYHVKGDFNLKQNGRFVFGLGADL